MEKLREEADGEAGRRGWEEKLVGETEEKLMEKLREKLRGEAERFTPHLESHSSSSLRLPSNPGCVVVLES
ncbi:hypothetical protein KOW79_017015 [Hemibagrus wyckioides]|uniref:Uncharacterized protein n=1 Tax=Hemibagrus wyckioides TaxID=337641 RepID=A0A9D3NCU7_9TELE|nr:hypothetical protein KOW79_017015 [Hemibagrus wyckioides]